MAPAPDLNSLPATSSAQNNQQTSSNNHTMASAPQQHLASRNSDLQNMSPTLSHSPTSLAAAATMNAGFQSEERGPAQASDNQSQNLERRRSSIRMSLAMNDPALPAPGELAASPAAAGRRLSSSLGGPPSPVRHARAPSLGELHQELENEQEAQVNRLLGMIRRQQQQIDQMQSHQPHTSMAIDDSNPPSDISRSQTPSLSQSSRRQNSSMSQALAASAGHSHSPSPLLHARSSFSHHGIPAGATEEFPALPPHAGIGAAGTRDDPAFYQAETQSLTRENQMLKSRIRELERQLAESSGAHAGPDHHSPVRQSSLHTAQVQTQE